MAPTSVCNLDTQLCVQCTAEDAGACTGDTAVCDTSVGQCVECTASDRSACAGAKAICDTSIGQCVQCTPSDPSTCSGSTPVCGADNACHPCTRHSECASNTCLPDGRCTDLTDTAYVDPTGTDTISCTKERPCPSLKEALNTNKPYIRMTGNTTANVSFTNQNVALVADRGSQVSGVTPGQPILSIGGSSQVSIYDLEITKPKNMIVNDPLFGSREVPAPAIVMPPGNTATLALENVSLSFSGIAIDSTGGKIRISKSLIKNNLTGIKLNGGSLDIAESIVIDNFATGDIRGGCTAIIASTTFTKNGDGLVVSGGGNLTLSQSTINNNTSTGLHSSDGGLVTVRRSTVSDNDGIGLNGYGGSLNVSQSTISANKLGGIVARGDAARFHIINNFIFRNADSGVEVFDGAAGTLAFNTIVDNNSQFGAGGIRCSGGVSTYANLVVRNGGGDTGDVRSGVPSCSYMNSFIGGGADVVRFVAPDTNPYNYRLTGSTPTSVRDAVACIGDVTVDFDDHARPVSGCDIGADEY